MYFCIVLLFISDSWCREAEPLAYSGWRLKKVDRDCRMYFFLANKPSVQLGDPDYKCLLYYRTT